MIDRQPIERTDHDSGFGRWTLFRRKPSAALAGCVGERQGDFPREDTVLSAAVELAPKIAHRDRALRAGETPPGFGVQSV